MNVQMENGLPGAGADIEDCAVPLFDVALTCDLGGGQMTAADDFRICFLRFLEPREMALRDDQHMRGSLRVDVFEGKHVRIFVNFLRRNFTPNHAAEKAIAGGIGHDSLSF
jgi:hypothetical protein